MLKNSLLVQFMKSCTRQKKKSFKTVQFRTISSSRQKKNKKTLWFTTKLLSTFKSSYPEFSQLKLQVSAF